MHLLITAGGTREYIDPVRFISNASSGRMGFALARAALKAGHTVTLIAAPTSQRPPRGVKVVEVETTAEMFAAVRRHFRDCDCLIMAAAVCDYTPARPAASKLKKTANHLTIEFKPTPDILRWAAARKSKKQFIVGFALEDAELRERAEKKLEEKNLDMIVANTPQAMGAEQATVEIKLWGGRWIRFAKAPKSTIARKIIASIERAILVSRQNRKKQHQPG